MNNTPSVTTLQPLLQPVPDVRAAAQRGDAQAQNDLGLMYMKGRRGVTQSNAQAMAWFGKAAEQGLADAQYNLGRTHENGRSTAKDDAQATFWYRKAAEQGHAAAQNKLGWARMKGRGVTQSDTQATAWFRKAAKQGNLDGRGRLKQPDILCKHGAVPCRVCQLSLQAHFFIAVCQSVTYFSSIFLLETYINHLHPAIKLVGRGSPRQGNRIPAPLSWSAGILPVTSAARGHDAGKMPALPSP